MKTMGVTKAEIKMGAISELGSTVDDMLETSEKEVQQTVGARGALLAAQKKVEELVAVVKEDLDSGEIEKLCGDPMLMVKYVTRMIMRAGGVVDNLATKVEVQRIQALGSVATLKSVVTAAKKFYLAEKVKVDSGSADEMGPEKGDARPKGLAVSAAEDIAQRRAKAKADKSKKPKRKPRVKKTTKTTLEKLEKPETTQEE